MGWKIFWKEAWESIDAIKGFKAALWAGGTLIANHYKGKIIPVGKRLKKVYNSDAEIQALKLELKATKRLIHIYKNVQDAGYQTAPDAFFRMNLKGEITYVNPVALTLSGFNNADDLKVLNYTQIIDEDEERVLRKVKSMIDHPSTCERQVKIKQFLTGTIINTICRVQPIYDEEGSLVETIGRLSVIN